MDEHWLATWVAGPDAGSCVRLASGRHYLGRSPACAVRADDPALEAHHAEIVLGASVEVIDLAAHVQVESATAATTVDAGSSRLRLTRVSATDTDDDRLRAAQISGTAVHRTPRPPRPPRPAPITVPPPVSEPVRRTSGLLPALVGVGAAAVLAIITGQTMFILFGAIGASVAVASWAVQRSGERRSDRRQAMHSAAEQHAFEAALTEAHHQLADLHRYRTMTLDRAVESAALPTVELWQRRAVDDDAFVVGLGSGPLTVTASLDGRPSPGDLRSTATLDDQPVATDLRQARLVIRGDAASAASVTRSMIVQLVVACGPADLRLIVVSDDAARWAWLGAVPHLATTAGPAVFGAEALPPSVESIFGSATDGLVVVVCDQPEALAARSQPLRRLLDSEGVALLSVVAADRGVPQVADAVLEVSSTMRGAWRASIHEALSTPVRCAGISERRAAKIAAVVAGLTDPDDPLAAATRLPSIVELDHLLIGDGLEFTPASIAAGWLAGGNDPPAATPIGVALDGPLVLDLAADGPHGLVAGTTGSGKSELLRSLVIGLAAACSPEHLSMVLVDYKGGSTFDACAALPHVAGVITDLDERLAGRALRSLRAELRHREELFRHHRVGTLTEYRCLTTAAPLTRLVVIIDEFAALTVDQPEFLHALIGIAQRGRSLGVHLILATQRPAGVISDDIRANTNVRIALRLLDRADAIDVVGQPAPVGFRRDQPGRAAASFGAEECVVFQSARVDAAPAVAAIAEAATLVGTRTVRPPWRPPLGRRVDQVQGWALGLIDDPDAQRYEYLQWMPADGSVLVAAASGFGVSETLRRLTETAVARPNSPTHATVIAAKVDERWAPFDQHPLISAVIAVDDHERVRLALARLATTLVERRERGGWASDEPRQVLVVDGFDELWRSLDPVFDADATEHLLLIASGGAGSGLAMVIGTSRPTNVPLALLATCRQRWIGTLTEPSDAACVGLSPSQLPAAIPGRLIIDRDGREAQIVCPPNEPGERLVLPPVNALVARRIDRLAARIPIEQLSAARRYEGRTTNRLAGDTRSSIDTILPIGRRLDGDEATMTLRPGDHLLVLGPSRSGRSTALSTVAEQWARATPHGRVVDAAGLIGRDAHGDQAAADEPMLVVVDDAELVDDVDGQLAAALASRQRAITVIAGGHPELLRRAYGHWTTPMRASRHALIAVGGSETDGDLVGVSLPRRSPVRARPGLMWLVEHGELTMVQVAVGTAGFDGAGEAVPAGG